jgi:hypothetical protein
MSLFLRHSNRSAPGSEAERRIVTGEYKRRYFMARSNYHLLLPAVALAVALSSCAHTTIISTWKDPEHQGYPKKVLVYDMAISPDVKIISENLFVEQFKKHGVSALASHKFLPDDMVVDKEALKKIVKEQEIDAVFIGGPRSRKDLQTLRPGSVSYQSAVYADPEDGFYAAVSGFAYTPGTYAEEEVAWELVLYDVSTKKRIWSVAAETYVENTRVEEVRPGVARIIKLLVADKMIP